MNTAAVIRRLVFVNIAVMDGDGRSHGCNGEDTAAVYCGILVYLAVSNGTIVGGNGKKTATP